MALNLKQQLFVKEYLLDKNASRAARAAGYSKKTAGAQAHKLLKKAEIAELIAQAFTAHAEKADLKATDVIAEIRKLAFVKLTHAFNPDGTLLPFDEMPEDVQAALASSETDEIYVGRGPHRKKIGATRKIKLSDKVRSLEMLAKYFKLLTDVQEISGANGGPQVVFHTFANGTEAPEIDEAPLESPAIEEG